MPPPHDLSAPLSRAQGDAWAAWNASYHEPNADAYRALARALYLQDMHERIVSQFAKLDEQNAQLDAVLASRSSRIGSEAA